MYPKYPTMNSDNFIYYDKHDLIKQVSSSNIPLNEEIINFPSSLPMPKSADQSLMERFVQSDILIDLCYDYKIIEVIRKPEGELSFFPEILKLTTLNYSFKSFKEKLNSFFQQINVKDLRDLTQYQFEVFQDPKNQIRKQNLLQANPNNSLTRVHHCL